MNQVVLIGRLTSNPELRGDDTKYTSFRLAVNRETKDKEADFITCKAFGKTAENLVKYKGKGDEIAVTGRIQTGSYKNSEGRTIYTTDVMCSRVEFTSGSKGGEPERESHKTDTSNDAFYAEPDTYTDSFSLAEDDIPF